MITLLSFRSRNRKTFALEAPNDCRRRNYDGWILGPSNNSLYLLPIVQEFKVDDVPNLFDRAYEALPGPLFGVLNALNVISTLGLLIFAVFGVIFLPIAALKITGVSEILFSVEDSNGTTISNTSFPYDAPWGETFDGICYGLYMFTCFSSLIVVPTSLMKCNPQIVHATVMDNKFKLGTIVTLNAAYTVGAFILIPTFEHAMFLLIRWVFTAFVWGKDALSASFRFRLSSEDYEKLVGKRSVSTSTKERTKHGILTIFLLWLGFLAMSADLFRHSLMLWKGDDSVLIDFGYENPFNGHRLQITNSQIVVSCFWTVFFFNLQAHACVWSKGYGNSLFSIRSDLSLVSK